MSACFDQVMQSEQLVPASLSPWIAARMDGSVLAAHCDCMEGLSEACTHAAALLFTIEANVRVIETGTVDDEEVKWMMPSAVEKLLYRPLSEIDFTPAGGKAGWRCQPVANSVAASSHSNSMHCSPPRNIPTPTQTEIDEFYHTLHASGAKSAILSLIEPYSNEFVQPPIQSTSGESVPSCSVNGPSFAGDCAETPATSEDNIWCFCKGVESGRMIACDNEGCSIEWFHYTCVGIKRKPKGKWYCPECSMQQ